MSAALAAVGAFLASPAVSGTVGAVSAIASTGLGIAQAAGAFDKDVKTPTLEKDNQGRAAIASRRARSAAGARNSNIFAGNTLGAAPGDATTALFGPGSGVAA